MDDYKKRDSIRVLFYFYLENMGEKIYLTKEGQQKLKEELKHLSEVKRASVAEQIKEARSYGDILQNPVYDAAVEEQGYIEGRISEIEEILGNSEIIKKTNGGDANAVFVGSTVVVNVNGVKDSFTIVGVAEADPVNKLISNESPVGKSLLGAKIGDEVKVVTPIFTTVYKIVEIK